STWASASGMCRTGASHRDRRNSRTESQAMSETQTPEPSGFKPLRPKWRRGLLLGSLILIPICLALPFVYFVYSCDRELRQAFAEVDRLDPGWRMPDLEQNRTVILDEEN